MDTIYLSITYPRFEVVGSLGNVYEVYEMSSLTRARYKYWNYQSENLVGKKTVKMESRLIRNHEYTEVIKADTF